MCTDLIRELKKKESYGTIDRLKRGIITEEQAQAELHGDHSHIYINTSKPDPYEFAIEIKRAGIGRQESWSRWIQRTGLKPEMDAKDWYIIYDKV